MQNNNQEKIVTLSIKKNLKSGFIFIPIAFEGKYCGKISMRFKSNQNHPESVRLGIEFGRIAKFLGRDMATSLKKNKIFSNLTKSKSNLELFLQFYLTLDDAITAQQIIYDPDDESIFTLIIEEGPIALRNLDVQRKLKQWLSAESIRTDKINRLMNSLLEYKLHRPTRDMRFTEGRRPLEIVQVYGTEWIIDFYYDIVSTLRIVKKERKSLNSMTLNEFLNRVFIKVMKLKKENFEKDSDSDLIKNRISKLIFDIERFEEISFEDIDVCQVEINPIAYTIENDDFIKNMFYSFRWQPNKMAKEVLSKILNISTSKIEKIISPGKKHQAS